MADLIPDDVAVHVAGADAVTLVGYLSEGDSEGFFKLSSTYFDRWLVLQESEILYQMSEASQQGGRSTLWVERNATITLCVKRDATITSEEAPAIEFAGEFAKSEDQPGPDEPRRRPPY